MAKNYKNYTNKEMQAITIAKEIKDGQIVIVGTGLPLIGATVAKNKFAPNCKLIVESGLMDCSPIEVPRSVGRWICDASGSSDRSQSALESA